MEFEMYLNSGEGDGKGEYEKAQPKLADDGVSVVHVAIGAEHMKQISNLKPGAKLSITLRGTVKSFEQALQEGYGAPTGELCVEATELKLSRGSEFDELLEED